MQAARTVVYRVIPTLGLAASWGPKKAKRRDEPSECRSGIVLLILTVLLGRVADAVADAVLSGGEISLARLNLLGNGASPASGRLSSRSEDAPRGRGSTPALGSSLRDVISTRAPRFDYSKTECAIAHRFLP